MALYIDHYKRITNVRAKVVTALVRSVANQVLERINLRHALTCSTGMKSSYKHASLVLNLFRSLMSSISDLFIRKLITSFYLFVQGMYLNCFPSEFHFFSKPSSLIHILFL